MRGVCIAEIGGDLQKRQSRLCLHDQAITERPSPYSERTSIADRSDIYIVGIERLMSPVATFAWVHVVNIYFTWEVEEQTYKEE